MAEPEVMGVASSAPLGAPGNSSVHLNSDTKSLNEKIMTFLASNENIGK